MGKASQESERERVTAGNLEGKLTRQPRLGEERLAGGDSDTRIQDETKAWRL